MASRSRRAEREESWSSVHHSEATNEISSDDFDEHSRQSPTPLRTIGDVRRAIHPLQATADRVGKQVELFAETLDRHSNKRSQKPARDCRHVLPLVYEYERIARDTVKRLKKSHEPERQEKLRRSWRRRLRSSSGRATPIEIHEDVDMENRTTVADLQSWEQERQTWQLFGIMLEVQYPIPSGGRPVPSHGEKFIRPEKGIEVHPYSPEQMVWKKYLSEDDDAWERHVVVEWLKMSADSSGQDIDTVVEALESGADRGTGLWAHGWLYSKEAIKAKKRLRSWPQPLDPESPGIHGLLISQDKTHELVTQLDPDAVSRQGRTLVKEDWSFEQATWLACWEMVRRGRSWEEIREWCQERVEGWRALSMRGDPRTLADNTDVLAGRQSRKLWRTMCAEAALHGVDDHENAVYGVLSGYLPSVEKIVRGWDDYMFARYNSYLLHGFDQFVQQQFLDPLSQALVGQDGATSRPDLGALTPMSGAQLVDKMLVMDRTKAEAMQPMRMLQGSLISKRFHEFVYTHGLKLAQSANENGRSKIMRLTGQDTLQNTVTADITLDHHDLLRILTHMILIVRELEPISKATSYGVDNIIAAYVDYLGKAGKQQLLPLYASRITGIRSLTCMGRQLPFILDASERQMTLRLMKEYDMDVPGVLYTQITLIILDALPFTESSLEFPKMQILEDENPGHNGIRPVRNRFMGNDISDEEADLLAAIEWFMLLDGCWKETLIAGAAIYKHFLRNKSLAAARALSTRVNFSTISLGKTQALLGERMDLSRVEADSEAEDHDHGFGPQTKNRKRRRSSFKPNAKLERELLLSYSKTFRDLEGLTRALVALEKWKEVADQAAQQGDPRHARGWKTDMQNAHDAVVATVEPLLQGWLTMSHDEIDAKENRELRLRCLPEIVLAYNSVLNFGGHALSREVLLKCMDLAAKVAEEGSDLGECFRAAGRMSELMHSMATASKSIMRAEEAGQKLGKKVKARKLKGENLQIWSVRSS